MYIFIGYIFVLLSFFSFGRLIKLNNFGSIINKIKKKLY